MGIDVWNLALLLEGRRRSGGFGDMLQIGRQGLHIPADQYPAADALLAEAGIERRFADIVAGHRYADEGLLQAMGARTAAAADASDYEQATLIHDFNDPVPDGLHQCFDTVFDGGSLEHIFNVPNALGNMMKLLRVGGWLISSLPANNWLGHGFYQFGPELPFRTLTGANGFALDAVFLPLMSGNSFRLLPIGDTGALGDRGEIGRTATHTGLMFVARKIEHVEPFRRWPQQGDYAAVWSEPSKAHQDSMVLLKAGLDRPASLPRRIARRIKRALA